MAVYVDWWSTTTVMLTHVCGGLTGFSQMDRSEDHTERLATATIRGAGWWGLK